MTINYVQIIKNSDFHLSSLLIFLKLLNFNMIDEKEIKQRIKELRKEQKMTQFQMADKLGLCRNAYCAIESGATHIINEHLSAIVEDSEMSVEELVLGYKPMKDEKVLEEIRVHYENKLKNLDKEKETVIQNLRQENDYLKEIIESYKKTVTNQEYIIKMLTKESKNV